MLQPVIILHIVVIIGVTGYMLIEDYTFMEAIYMTTITVTTTGFMEVRPLTDAGRAFTSLLLIVSWGTLALAITRITQYVVNGEINKYFKTRRMINSIDHLSNHVMICGFGRNGQQAAQTLRAHNLPFVVIEKNEKVLEKAAKEIHGLLYILGDGTDDVILKQAGIEHAKALITTMPVDADNLFIVLSAKEINPSIQIISRASESSSVPKLKKAGADSVIMPDKIGGMHMATLISKPDVIEFIDFLSGEEGEAIHIEAISYNQLPADIKDKSLQEIMAWRKTGVNCIGVKDLQGKFIINPPDIITNE